MKKILYFIVGIVTLIFIVTYAYASEDQFEAEVIKVTDGDTITVRNIETDKIEKIRLYCIDAPELSQEHGEESKNQLARLLQTEKISIIPIDKDRYGRTVAIIKTSEQQFSINSLMVLDGHAWLYHQYCKTFSVKSALRIQQMDAKLHNRGIWSSENPTAPWIYRRKQKND